jgi:hypothetical protein
MGIEARGCTRKLCSQGCSKGNNDINKLTLHNKRAKSACGQSAFQKDPNNITSLLLSEEII